ncbi:MAG TPA: hypothetical protein VMM80_11035 [Bacteroidota bacterium]|nr:hypothetical protein [Bacteroidota bacterium]
MKQLFLVAVFTLVPALATLRAQSDTAAFRAAVAQQNPTARISALVEFVGKYPGSVFTGGAYNALFSIYIAGGNEKGALEAADRSLATLPPQSRGPMYNQYAYVLATNNMGIDTALVYATRAEEMARGESPASLSPVQDTRAFVLYRKGDFAGAEALQRQAVRGHEDDPEYLGHLAMYLEADARRREALAVIARAMYLGGGPEMKSRFIGWLDREEKDPRRRDALKSSVVMKTVHEFIDTTHGDVAAAARSSAAAFMASLNVDLPQAARYAGEAIRSLRKDSPVEDAVTYKQNLALVDLARGRSREALKTLEAIKDLASPWSTDFWLALGGLYRKLGRRDAAVNAYMSGLMGSNPPELRDSLASAYRALHGSMDGLGPALDTFRESGASFDPGKYAPQAGGKGRTVLAELFTGAECGPCVAADQAFDALTEYFPSSALVVLEYHVHVPGPDPLTTNVSWSRYKGYGGRGTPTVVIDGRERIVGGGPRFVARNRFNLYRYTIGKYIGDPPGVTMNLDVSRRRDSVAVTARIDEVQGLPVPAHALLHVALVERSVDYLGGNGISRQAMVVRSLMDGGNGIAVNPGGMTINVAEDVASVDSANSRMLDDPKSEPSWPGRNRNFGGWRSRPAKIDRGNLLVVAWVQDGSSGEVLQVVSRAVPEGMSAN